MVKRLVAFAYGIACYGIFFGTFLYATGFIGDVVVPRAMDSGPDGPLGPALLTNLALLTLLAVQHSVMARPAFKRVLSRVVPPSVERSTYVLASSLVLLVLFWQWRPMGGTVWRVDTPAGRGALHALYAAGWLTILVSTFLINHFDLFGLRQVWLHLRGLRYTPLTFRTPGPYRSCGIRCTWAGKVVASNRGSLRNPAYQTLPAGPPRARRRPEDGGGRRVRG